MKTVPAKNLMCTIAVNVNNPLLTDEIRKEIDAAILNDLKVVGCEKAEEK